MGKNKSKKQKQPSIDPQFARQGEQRQPVVERSVETAKQGHAVWQFNTRDTQAWTWENADYTSLLPKLADIERRGFKEIRSRGRTRGEHHFIPRGSLEPEAERRLKQRCLDDVDEVFSIHIAQKSRAWAVVYADHIACLLWWDPEHTVYPVNVANN